MKLILCADDYAQSAGIDEAIIQLIKQKRLSATSCMTLSPRWREAAKHITPAIRKQAAIGLHLDFTNFGNAYPHSKLIALSYACLLSKSHIAERINQQLDLFEGALGAAPDYIDGHQHVHQLPLIRDALIDILKKRYKDKLPWLRIARPPVNEGVKGWIIRALGANTLQKKAERAGFNYSDCLLGVYGFHGDAESYKRRLSAWLKNNKGDKVAVLMCHPSVTSTDQDAIYQARLAEFEVLNTAFFDALLKTHQITLVKSPS